MKPKVKSSYDKRKPIKDVPRPKKKRYVDFDGKTIKSGKISQK